MIAEQQPLFYMTTEFLVAVCALASVSLLCMLSGTMGYYLPYREIGWKYELVQVTVFFGGSIVTAVISSLATNTHSVWFPVLLFASFITCFLCMGLTHRICRLHAEANIRQMERHEKLHKDFMAEHYVPELRPMNDETILGKYRPRKEVHPHN